jgi:hypothetical protein
MQLVLKLTMHAPRIRQTCLSLYWEDSRKHLHVKDPSITILTQKRNRILRSHHTWIRHGTPVEKTDVEQTHTQLRDHVEGEQSTTYQSRFMLPNRLV